MNDHRALTKHLELSKLFSRSYPYSLRWIWKNKACFLLIRNAYCQHRPDMVLPRPHCYTQRTRFWTERTGFYGSAKGNMALCRPNGAVRRARFSEATPIKKTDCCFNSRCHLLVVSFGVSLCVRQKTANQKQAAARHSWPAETDFYMRSQGVPKPFQPPRTEGGGNGCFQ